MLKIGWFSTGNGKGSLGFIKFFLDYVKENSLDISLEYVFCNRDYNESEGSNEFLDFLKSNNIKTITFSSTKFLENSTSKTFSECRTEYDIKVQELISNYDTDIIIMAGYMLILSPFLCNNFNFINLHPALPNGPKGTWTEVIKQLICNNASESGLNVHIVNEKLDDGASLGYCRFSIKHNMKNEWNEYNKLVNSISSIDFENLTLFNSIRNKILDRERILLLLVINDFVNNKEKLLYLYNDKQKSSYKTIDFSKEVEGSLS